MEITERERTLFDRLARGWNTRDVYSTTAHVYLPDRLRLHVAFVVPHLSGYSGDILWDKIESFGEHSIDGSCTDQVVTYLNGLYRIESTAAGMELIIRVTPVKPRHGCFVIIEVSPIWGSRIDIAHHGAAIVARSSTGNEFVVSAAQPVELGWNPSRSPSLACGGDRPAYFSVNCAPSTAEMDRRIAEGRAAWESRVIGAEGDLGEGLAALRRSLLWNTIYEPRHGRVVTPVSRNWCQDRGRGFGDYVLFGWDTFFASLQLGLVDRDMAYAAMFSILEEITPEGMVPNFGSGNGTSRDRSEPQVGSLCAWKLYQQFGDLWFLEDCFDRLLAWNRWLFRERDLNGDGLLEYASIPWNAGPDDEFWAATETGGRQAEMWESGLDDSPLWDRARFNEGLHCLELADVGLNSLAAMDCEILARIAGLLGREEERRELSLRREALVRRMNDLLWDERIGCYVNRHWSGELDSGLGVTHFYAITAGVAQGPRLRRTVAEHLLNEREFWGDWVIPNSPRTDPAFAVQHYWRGRIWAPTNYIVGEGLLRAGMSETHEELARKSLALFLRCWRERSVVGENYNAVTGEAAEKGAASDRFYHWGSLMVFMAVQRIVNASPWSGGIELHAPAPWLGPLRRVPLGDRMIDVERGRFTASDGESFDVPAEGLRLDAARFRTS